jgi:CBS-domain-containing membrane protein
MITLGAATGQEEGSAVVYSDSANKQTIPTERPPLVGEVIATFADKGCHVVSVMDPYGRIFGFLYRSRYFSIK